MWQACRSGPAHLSSRHSSARSSLYFGKRARNSPKTHDGNARATRRRIGFLAERFEQTAADVEVVFEPGSAEECKWPFRVAQPQAECFVQILGRGKPFVEPAQESVVKRTNQAVDDPPRK